MVIEFRNWPYEVSGVLHKSCIPGASYDPRNTWNETAHSSRLFRECYLRLGKAELALKLLEDSSRTIADRSMRGFTLTIFRNSMVSVRLAAADQAEEVGSAIALGKAQGACREALEEAKLSRVGLAQAYRLQGTYNCLNGHHIVAQDWWRRSIATAEAQGTRYDIGMIYLEMGSRMVNDPDLQRAAAIFVEIGAELEALRARQLLKRKDSGVP